MQVSETLKTPLYNNYDGLKISKTRSSEKEPILKMDLFQIPPHLPMYLIIYALLRN
jgi:hypothetical protein